MNLFTYHNGNMDVYFEAILIVGGIIFIKLVIIICAYACRVRRINRQNEAAAQNNNNGEQSYPATPYNSRTPIMNFEETPQTIYTVAPGSDPSAIPALSPPPYEVAAGNKDHKPPTYDQVLTEANLNVCETGEETVQQENSRQERSQFRQEIINRPVAVMSSLDGLPPPYSHQQPT